MAPMILYPAIDLKDGQCVRLLHGDMEKATVFNTSPADQAQRFASAAALRRKVKQCFVILPPEIHPIAI